MRPLSARPLMLAVLCTIVVAELSPVVSAQELRVYTVTRVVERPTAKPTTRPEVVARSLTLFHARKVYDYIDALREVTIFDPAHKRFTILNEASSTYAYVSQDEVRRFLDLAKGRANELAVDLAKQSDPQQQSALPLLRFQLQPEFQSSYDPAARRLKLISEYFDYEAVCAEAQPAIADAYLNYADAVSELNSVLHPHSFLPGPRMELNRELRSRKVLPMTVRRTVRQTGSVEWLAEHQWKWALTESDRQLIDLWESRLAKSELHQLSFEQMQRAVLTGKLSQR